MPCVLAGVVIMLFAHRFDAEPGIVHGHDHVHWRVGVELGDAGHVCQRALAQRMPAMEAAIAAASERLRPILMTACAMTVGMIPMSMALEAGSQMQAPLGRAVIGGLIMSTIATLLIVPSIFALVLGNSTRHSVSVHPDDAESPVLRSARGARLDSATAARRLV